MDLNPFMEKLRQKGLLNSTDSISTTRESPLAAYGLDYFHCEQCNDTGTLLRTDENGVLWSRECECMKRRRSLRNIKSAELQTLAQRYTFDTYQTPTAKHEAVKKKAIEFCESDAAAFLISGQSGAGKSHVCVAIVSQLINDGGQAQFLQWRRDAPEMKALLTEDHAAYKHRMKQLREAQILYIDDFFKGSITDADKNLAFTILNDRYNSDNLRTIISTELTAKQLLETDEAIGGRLLEMARGYTIEAPPQNWRLKK